MKLTCTIRGLLGRGMLTGVRRARLCRLALGAILVLGVPAFLRAAESVPPTPLTPAPVAPVAPTPLAPTPLAPVAPTPVAPATATAPTTPPAPSGSLRDLLKAARADPLPRETIVALKALLPAQPDERVREPLTCAVAIGLRYAGDMEGFAQLNKEMRERYPESALLPSLEDEAFEQTCTVCDGKGGTQRTCEKCGGRRTCPNSKCEVGMIRYRGFKGWEEKPCSICKGTGQCPVCKGVGTVLDPCAACKGKGRRETKTRDREVFLAALDRVQVGVDFAAQTPATPAAPAGTPPKDKRPDAGNTEVGGTDTTPSSTPGSGRTPDYLLPLLKEYGAWLNAMQTRAGMAVATRIRAEDETGRAILHVVVTRDLLRQPRAKRTQTLEALRGMWVEKVTGRRFEGRRLTPATIFENDTGGVVRDTD